MTSMTDTNRGGRAAKVLTAAKDLVLKQGFKGVTMAAVAQRAHVGKGTPYLYWRAKEDLFLELIVSDLAEVLAELADRVRATPVLATADQLCPTIAEAWLTRPLMRALLTSDADVLGALLDDPRIHTILVENGAPALVRALLPVWRDRGLVRVDWSPGEQVAALELVLVGYFVTQARGVTVDGGSDHRDILQRAVAAVLQTRDPSGAEADLAESVRAVLESHALRLRELVV